MATAPTAPPLKQNAQQPPPAGKKDGDKPVDSPAITEFTSRYISPKPSAEKPAAAAPKNPEKPTPRAGNPRPAVPPSPAPSMNAAEIAETAARIAVEAVRPVPAEKKPEETPESKLPKDEQKKISNLQEMEKLNPEKYKGLAERYQKSLSNLVEYAEKWEKDHPGEQFDEEDDEHKEFMAENDDGLDWDDEDYIDAVAELKVQKVTAESRKLTEEQQAKTKLIQDALPAIEATKLSAGKSFLELAGKEYAAIIGADGKIIKEAVDKLASEDPVKTQIIITSSDYVERLVAENYALFNQIVPFNGQNPLHTSISTFIIQKEQQLTKLPAEQQRDAQGRAFKPAADFWKLPEETRKRFWTFSQKDVEVLLVNGVYKQTKAQIAEEDKKFAARAKARGINLEGNGNGRPAAPAAPENETAPLESDDDKPNTPTIQAQPPAGGAGAQRASDPQTIFEKKFLG